MYQSEYDEAKRRLKSLRKPNRRNLKKFLEALVTVKGHAWCMDVSSERKKMAKLMADIFKKV